LFSPHVVNPLSTFDGSNRTKTTNLNPVENLVKKPAPPQIKQLRVLDDTDAKGVYTIPLAPVSYVPSFEVKSPVTEVIGEDYSNGQLMGASDGLIVEQSTITNNKLTLPFRVKPGSLQQGHTYKFRIISRPTIESYRLPAWWTDWNLDMGGVVSRTTNKYAKIDGSKTQNLKMFLSGLWQANLLINKPKIFDSYLVVQVKGGRWF